MKQYEYEQMSKIGQGTYGCVYKGKDKDNNTIAIKQIKYQTNQSGIPANALRQISLLKSLGQHQNIIKIIKVNYQALEKKLQIIFEYCQYDLKRYQLIGHKEDNEAAPCWSCFFAQQKSDTSRHKTAKHYVRYIKYHNTHISIDNIKIADFGLARYAPTKHKTLTREVETLWYRAPEVMLGMKNYSFPIDVWAIGCVFGELYLKRPLFMGSQYQIQQIFKVFQILGTPTKQQWPNMQNLTDYSIEFPKWKKQSLSDIIKNMPGEAVDLLQKMLICDPQKRITAVNALNHPYLA